MAETAEGTRKRIAKMFRNGCSLKEIARAKDKTIEEIEAIIIEEGLVKVIKTRSSGILGSKTEPYYKNEFEMFNSPMYKYEDLTQEEKDFYESRTDM
jgi:hypothetical protein